MKKELFPVLIDLSEKHVMVLLSQDGDYDEPRLLSLVQRLHACTGHLSLYAASRSASLMKLSEEAGVSLTVKSYKREDLFGADVVICTLRDPALRGDVFAACHTLGIRLCIPGEPARSDFILP